MAQNKPLIWLHRIGYITTAIVAAELLAFSIIAIPLWKKDREYLVRGREMTRTHQGSLVAQNIRFRPDGIDLLATLPPLKANGLRFVAMPQLRDHWFALSVLGFSNESQDQGILKIFSHPDKQQGSLIIERTVQFFMPKPAADRLFLDIRRMTDNWGGERADCLDGTGVAFELSIEGRITSGMGNSACSTHYGAVSLHVLKSISQFIPNGVRPAGKDWRPAS